MKAGGDDEIRTDGKDIQKRPDPEVKATESWAYVVLVLLAAVTYGTVPTPFQPHGEPTIMHVFYYGWLTALSTGAGVLPFVFLPNVASIWVGISNGAY